MKKCFLAGIGLSLLTLCLDTALAETRKNEDNYFRDYFPLSREAGCRFPSGEAYQSSGLAPNSILPRSLVEQIEARVEACSLPEGFSAWRASWGSEWPWEIRAWHDPGMVLAGPSVKDGVTRYWRQGQATHVRIPLNAQRQGAGILYFWARKEEIAMRLSLAPLREEGSIRVMDPIVVRATTNIPVFIVSPQGLAPARIVQFVAGGGSCAGGDWLELSLENDAEPAIWAVIALHDRGLAEKARVTRLPPETREVARHDYEIRRGILKLEFEDGTLPPLMLVARELGFREEHCENDVCNVTLLGSAWGTQVYSARNHAVYRNGTDAYNAWIDSHVSFLGSPRCPPPPP
jgi:hypothetical protein